MVVGDDALVRIERHVRGPVLRSGAALYDEARRTFNGMIDRHPAVIVRPEGADDVAAAIRWPRSSGCPSPFAAAATALPAIPSRMTR